MSYSDLLKIPSSYKKDYAKDFSSEMSSALNKGNNHYDDMIEKALAKNVGIHSEGSSSCFIHAKVDNHESVGGYGHNYNNNPSNAGGAARHGSMGREHHAAGDMVGGSDYNAYVPGTASGDGSSMNSADYEKRAAAYANQLPSSPSVGSGNGYRRGGHCKKKVM